MIYGKTIALDDKEFGSTTLDGRQAPARSEAEELFVDRLRAGDREAFDQLVTRYTPDIYGFLCRMTRDPEEASDITQDTFLRAFKAISRFRGDSSVKTWLFRIAINQSRNRFRWWKRRKRDATVSLDAISGSAERPLTEVLPSDARTPEEDAIRREQGRAIVEAISELPEHYRETIVLCDVQGFQYDEIASILGINLGTVKSRISRGREELRKRLKDI